MALFETFFSFRMYGPFSPSVTFSKVQVTGRAGALSSQETEEPSALTLQQAVKIGLERNPLRKAALADTKVASADVREARSVLMPRLMFSETATGGNDPAYAVGSELRQQRFTAA